MEGRQEQKSQRARSARQRIHSRLVDTAPTSPVGWVGGSRVDDISPISNNEIE